MTEADAGGWRGFGTQAPYGCWCTRYMARSGRGRGLRAVAVLTYASYCLSQRSLPPCRTRQLLPSARHWLLPAAGWLAAPSLPVAPPIGAGRAVGGVGLPGRGHRRPRVVSEASSGRSRSPGSGARLLEEEEGARLARSA